MEVFRVSLFGHRDFNGHRALDDRLYPMLRDLLSEKEFVEIFIGRNGENNNKKDTAAFGLTVSFASLHKTYIPF